MIKFADSTRAANISPFEFSHVAAYATGAFAWSEEDLARFEAHFLIGVEPDHPEQARIARCLDMERFDASARDFPDFVSERKLAGHNDALGYTSILGQDPGEGILAIIESVAHLTVPWRLWVAWWWGRPFAPTAAEVLAEIKALTGYDLPPSRLAACQWQNGETFDTSVWYIRDTFTRRHTAAANIAARLDAADSENQRLLAQDVYEADGGDTMHESELAALRAKAPAWTIEEKSYGAVATLDGTTTELQAGDLAGLEARIRQLYPDTIQ